MKKKLKYILVFIPISVYIFFLKEDSIWTFITSALAIIPLAMYMNFTIDKIASNLGSTWGGLLSITFGNTTELIISLFAIMDGLLNVVKAAITGTIIMNLLLILGLSFFVGGLKRRTQSFDRVMAITNSTMLMLAVAGMLIPAIFYFGSSNIRTIVLGKLSLGVGFVLFFTYLASLYFTLFIHEKEKNKGNEEKEPANNNDNSENENYQKNNSNLKYILCLIGITILISLQAHILVDSISIISEDLNISPSFIGIIVIPIIANVAENYTAINMAWKNKINLSINIAIGSSIQVALMLVPLLIFLSHVIGQPMNVLFNILEISSIVMSVLAINVVYLQGKSNWFEGLQLVAVYLIIALAFYFA
ncbi:MAG: calcium/proton exchanger [Halanaerobiales bacterium]